jgi:hypothetical protein
VRKEEMSEEVVFMREGVRSEEAAINEGRRGE